MNGKNEAEKYILNTFYQPQSDLRPYSFSDIAEKLEDFERRALESEQDIFLQYLLRLRTHYLIQEVCAKPHSNYTQALLGIFFISPYIVKQLVSLDGVNVFLARDAGRDFIASQIMMSLGLISTRSVILYFSRKNVRNLYSFARKITSENGAVSWGEREYYKRISEEIISNTQIREEAFQVYTTLQKSGLLNEKSLRFIDTWASGSLFFILYFIIRIFDENEYRDGKLVKKEKSEYHDLSFAVANDKKKIMVVETQYDYRNVAVAFERWWESPMDFYASYDMKKLSLPFPLLSFDCGSVPEGVVRSWYHYYGFDASFPQDFQSFDFCSIMGAQIYKGLNHFGSLNLGHPIEWNEQMRTIVPATNHKRIGSLLRELFLINAVLGYKDNYAVSIPQQPVKRREVPGREKLLQKRFNLSQRKAILLDRVLYENNEHIVTCHSSIEENLVKNIISTMEFFGYRRVAEMSQVENYNFQYYLNGIKSLPVDEYKERLKILVSIYPRKILREMLLLDAYHFVREVMGAKQLKKNLKREIEMIVFDIDGTLTPIEEGIQIIVKCLRKRKKLVFITGRPKSFCLELAERIQEKLPARFSALAQSILFYCSNGSEAFSIAGGAHKTRKPIPDASKKRIYEMLQELGLKISSERDYRIIATYEGEDKNPNKLLAYKEQLKALPECSELGIYLIKWGENVSEFNAIDICSSSKKAAIDDLLQESSISHVVIGDDPENSDQEIISDLDISVEGFGILKTKAVVKALLSQTPWISFRSKI